MKRKRHQEEHENHERWLVSYADFITLLFAFFVVMYSISSVNEGKYRVLSDALEAAFRAPATSLNPVSPGRATQAVPFEPDNPAMIKLPKLPLAHLAPRQEEIDVDHIAADIEEALKPLIEEDLVHVNKDQLSVEIELKSRILFASGSAIVAPAAEPILFQLANIIRRFDYPVRVEGHTDDVPISGGQFPSNWELSSARAGGVVRLLAVAGIDPLQLSASGFGEFRPIASNASEEGRSKNRRVVLVVDAGAKIKPDVETLIDQGRGIDPGLASSLSQGFAGESAR